jgi:hypothetical protein
MVFTDILKIGGTYGEDCYRTDGAGQYDEHGTAEQQCQRQLAPQRDIRAP